MHMDRIKEIFPCSSAPPIAMMGVPFDNVSTAETVKLIKQMVASRRPHYLATANVDFLVQASQDVELRRILFDAHLVLCDGTPLVWASRLLGNPLPERVAGSDLVPLLLQVAEQEGFRPFFLGSTPEVIEKAAERVKKAHPNLEIAGVYSPPFNKLLEMDHDEIRKRILAARPDLLFVGFGCPKQEKWINMHYRSLGVPVSVGVGGTIDFLAGKLNRAPLWMQRTGTEWIYRLAQEPKRLLGRYSRDLYHFSTAMTGQYCRMRTRKRRQPRSTGPIPVRREVEYCFIEMPERLDFETVHHEQRAFEDSITPERPCVIDLQKVAFIDSTGVGLLIRLQKRSRLMGQQLVCLNPSSNARRALQLMRLEDFFIIARDLAAAEKCLREANRSSSVNLVNTETAGLPSLSWRGELTAANADEIWLATADHLNARAMVQRSLAIDLSGLTFIDSTGLGVLIRAKKHGARQGVRVRFTGANGNVLNVVRLSRLEDYLFSEKA